MAARPIPEGMTVLRLGKYGRPSLATAGLLVHYFIVAALMQDDDLSRS